MLNILIDLTNIQLKQYFHFHFKPYIYLYYSNLNIKAYDRRDCFFFEDQILKISKFLFHFNEFLRQHMSWNFTHLS